MRQTVVTRVSVLAAAVLGACTIGSVVVAFSTTRSADAAVRQQSQSLAAAAQVQESSKFLTNTVRAFTATGDKSWLDQYWTEVDVTQSQVKALQRLKQLGTPAAEIALVNQAHDNSYELVKRETRAMRLVLDAERVPTGQMPQPVAAWQVSPQDAALNADSKLKLARELVFGAQYQSLAAQIMAPITTFNQKLSSRLQHQVDQDRSHRQLALVVLTVSALALLALLCAVLAVFHRQLGRIVVRYTALLRSRDPKDLTFRLPPTGVVEARQLAAAFNEQNEQVAGIVQQLVTQGDAVATTSHSLSDTASRLGDAAAAASQESGTASETAASVSDNVTTVAAATEQMTAAIKEIAHAASDASRVAADAVREAREIQSVVGQLSTSSNLIGDVMKTINSIAGQTKLLALNATIEAARAGEAGKGFAVVAGEVQDLAQQSAKATEDISERVSGIQRDTEATADGLRRIAAVIERINETQTTIASAVEEQTATTADIARSVQEAAGGAEAIASNIETVASQASVVARDSTTVLDAARSMSSTAEQLRELLISYRVA
jgi:methyl-accepting chemotaxis protein